MSDTQRQYLTTVACAHGWQEQQSEHSGIVMFVRGEEKVFVDHVRGWVTRGAYRPDSTPHNGRQIYDDGRVPEDSPVTLTKRLAAILSATGPDDEQGLIAWRGHV